VVDYTAGDFTRDAQAYDMVFDAVGKSSLLRCRRLLRPRGSYLWVEAGRKIGSVVIDVVPASS